jgi:FMN phosphatase YigB (HAD superfamily)
MNIELENNSAPPFIKFLNDRDIQGVAFDVDNTLIATGEYYFSQWEDIAITVGQYLSIPKDSSTIAQEFKNLLSERYLKRGKTPQNVIVEVLGGFEEYLGYINEDIIMIVNNHLKDFYNVSPNPLDSAYEIIEMLDKYDKKFVLCTHAQDDWTKVKVSLLEKEIEKQIPYLAVDINEKKDANSWKEATQLINIDIQEILVIGDNLEADIFPAIEAGCKNVIWINRKNRKLPEDFQLPDDISLFIIDDISQLNTLSN